MNKISQVSVKSLLMLALATIMVIGVALMFKAILPQFSTGPICVSQQEKEIHEINRILNDEVKSTGVTQTNIPFRVKYCVNCIWYEASIQSLGVNYTANPDPKYYSVPVPWINAGDSCGEAILKGGKTCRLKISVNSIEIESC